MFLLNYLEVNQDSSSKDDGLLPQDHTQAADETQTQTAQEAEPMTVHFAVTCKLRCFASSHEYQQNISHWLHASYVPQLSRTNLKDKIEEKATEIVKLFNY